jgi:hypothetical protein
MHDRRDVASRACAGIFRTAEEAAGFAASQLRMRAPGKYQGKYQGKRKDCQMQLTRSGHDVGASIEGRCP